MKELEAIEAIRNPHAAEQAAQTILNAALGKMPAWRPHLEELYGFDPLTFKHSVMVSKVASEAFIDYNGQSGDVSFDKAQQIVTALELGMLLHDVGKMGIEADLEQAHNTLNHDVTNKLPAAAQGGVLLSVHADDRNQDKRASTQTHSLIGGYILVEMLNQMPFEGNMAFTLEVEKLIASCAFDHHERAYDTISVRNSYPRSNGYRPTSREAHIAHIIAECSDIAVGMREPREYRLGRNGAASLDPLIIMNNLFEYLSPQLLYETFNIRPDDILRQAFKRQQIVGSVLKAVAKNDDAITQDKFDLEGWNIYGREWRGVRPENASHIPMMIRDILNNENMRARIMKLRDTQVSWSDSYRKSD